MKIKESKCPEAIVESSYCDPCHDILCNNSVLERPRYFPRQMVTDTDLTLEQEYLRQKLRRHNRMLHDWGVVCGARVCPVPLDDCSGEFEKWMVQVTAGYILGPYGDEIIICDRVVRVPGDPVSGVSGQQCGENVDPWCADTYEKPREPARYWIAVRYKEIPTRPVRTQPAGCGCEDDHCEYSRWRDGYEIAALECCPHPRDNVQSGRNGDLRPVGMNELVELPDERDTEKFGLNPMRGPFIQDCPPCPDGPWVGLASVEIDECGVIHRIDNCDDCRRVVPRAKGAYCRSRSSKIIKVDRTQAVGPGESGSIKVTLDYYEAPSTITLGQGIDIKKIELENGTRRKAKSEVMIKVDFEAKADAEAGHRTLKIVSPDCSWHQLKDAIEVTERKREVRAQKKKKKKKAKKRPK